MDEKYTTGINWTLSFRTRVDRDREGSALGNPLFENISNRHLVLSHYLGIGIIEKNIFTFIN